jgi:exopolysaccharide production protein ExoF
MTNRIRQALCAALLLVLSAGGAFADAYRLGVSDVVRIKVVEWLAADGQFRDWSEVTGEYAIGPGGLVAIPLLGEIPAAGKATVELAAEISGGLKQVLALQGLPTSASKSRSSRPSTSRAT